MDSVDAFQVLQRSERISQLFKSALKGQVLVRGQDGFETKTALFNAAARNHSWIVVSPLSTQEVVSVVNICRENNLSPSVKSGGFATAGWAREGDVMVDLSQMNHIELRVPSFSESTLYSKDQARLSRTETPSQSRRKASQAFSRESEGTADPRKKSAPMPISPVIIDSETLQTSESRLNKNSLDVRPGLGRGQKWSSKTPDAPIVREGGESSKAEVSKMEVDADASSQRQESGTPEVGMEADVEDGDETISEETPSDSPSVSNRSKSRASDLAFFSGSQAPRSLSNNSGSNGQIRESSIAEARSSLRRSHNQTSHWVDRLSVPSPVSSWNEGEDTPATSISSGLEPSDQEKTGSGASGDSGWDDPNQSFRHDSRGSGSSNDSTTRPNISSVMSPPAGANNGGSLSSHKRPPLYEHERWKRHHRPSTDQASSSKITLPATGGFIWRSGEGGEAASLSSLDADPDLAGGSPSSGPQFASSFPFEGPQPMHPVAGANRSNQNTLSGLQSAWPDYISSIQNYRSPNSPLTSSASPSGSNPKVSTPRISPPAGSSALYNGSSYASPSPIPPGVYPQRFALTSFGPGATVRMIDAYTEKAGRDNNFALPNGKMNERLLAGRGAKGKGKQSENNDSGVSLGPLDHTPEEEQKRFGQVARGAPYHCPMSAYPVGSASILTGGFGYLTRSYGLSLDNIVEVEMVLADGRVVTLNESSRSRSAEEADLWWAVRGAAPCFGIATQITCKAYPVPSVYSGNLIYPFNPATASSLICHWRDCLKSGAPRELYSNLILTAGPDAASHVVVIQICFLGLKNEGDPFVHALGSWSGERPLLKDVEERSFLSQQDGVASVLKESLGRRWMIRGDLVTNLSDEFISKSVLRFRALGIRSIYLFELVGGAVEDLDDTETSIGSSQRAAKFTIAALQQWHENEEDPRCIEAVDRWMKEDVSKVSTGGPFPCFLERNEPLPRVANSFGKGSFERLRRIKAKVDPNGMFRHTFGRGLVFDKEEDAALLAM